MYQFKFIIDDEIFYEFCRFHQFEVPKNKENMKVMKMIVPLFFFSFAFFLGLLLDLVILLVIIALIISAIWILTYNRRVDKMIRKRINKSEELGIKLYRGPVEMIFEDDYFIEITDEAETKSKYSAIMNMYKSESAIYLYVDATRAYLVPYLVFESEQQKDEFYQFLSERTTDKLNT